MKKIRVYNSWQELTLKGERENDIINLKTDTVRENEESMQISICLMDDLSDRQNVKIKEALKESGKPKISFNKFGIAPASYPFLEDIVSLLKENPDIRLELALHAIKDKLPGDNMEISEKLSRELTFYFINKGIDKAAFQSEGFGLSQPVFNQYIPDSTTMVGIIEFMFMSN
jgi:outer membrane protein OmpA-like peptidoglycan-associated protein